MLFLPGFTLSALYTGTEQRLGTITSKLLCVTFIAVASLMSQSTSSRTLAAEITCVEDYAKASLNNADMFKLLYPSGRRPVASTCLGILVHGKIETGDTDKFKKILYDNQPFVANVYLVSSGGSVLEAIQIGNLIRKYMLGTNAPIGGFDYFKNGAGMMVLAQNICSGQDCHCASSCFLIWAAGADRRGSVIGLHRPTTNSDEFAGLPIDQAAIRYRSELSRIKQYLVGMEIPQNIMDIMFSTASNGIHWLNLEEAESLAGMPPSIGESIAVACSKIKSGGDDSRIQRTICTVRKLANYRDTIAPVDAGNPR